VIKSWRLPRKKREAIMGNWTMHIEGHGIHDNRGNEKDADEMLRQFAAQLRLAGHAVHAVSFSSGTVKALPVPDTGSVESPPPDWQYRP
jgi:hypothetical protein